MDSRAKDITTISNGKYRPLALNHSPQSGPHTQFFWLREFS